MYAGERVVLRRVESADQQYLDAWDQDDELSILMGQDVLPSSRSYLEMRNSLNSLRLMIVTKAGDVIGNVDLVQISWRSREAELVIRIGRRDFWGQGYGTDAIRTVLRAAFSQLGLRSVYLRVYRTNTRAVRCYEKCGFRIDGILRRNLDSGGRVEILLMRADRVDQAVAVSAG